MFDPTADPEATAIRAAELSLEQLARLRSYTKQNGPDSGLAFYQQPFECGESNYIARLMSAYAVLKGLIELTDLPVN